MIRLLVVAAFALTLSLAASSGCGADSAQHGAPPLLVFGTTGMGPGEFSYPRAAAARPDGDFYVVDKAARIQRFSPDGTFQLEWQMPRKDAGKPTGLGVAPDGRVFVADTHYGRVMIYDAAGTWLAEFGTFGDAPGQLRLPTDVAVAPDGSVFVSQYGGLDLISKFSPDYEFVLRFGGRDAGAARLRRPQGLLFDEQGVLWVADGCNHRICRFDQDGRLLGAFGENGTGSGELRFPYSLDWMSDGSLVVTEYGNNRVQRFRRDGTSLGVWGRAGRKPGELAYPWAAVVGPDDRVFVVDSGNNRIQVIDGRDRDTWVSPPEAP